MNPIKNRPAFNKLMLVGVFLSVLLSLVSIVVQAQSHIEVMQNTFDNMPTMQQKERELEQKMKALLTDFSDRKESVIESYIDVELLSQIARQANDEDKQAPTATELAEFRKVAEQKYQEDFNRQVKALEKSKKIQLNGHEQKLASIQRTIQKESKKEQRRLDELLAKGLPESILQYSLVTGRGEVATFTIPEPRDELAPDYDIKFTTIPEYQALTNNLLGEKNVSASYSPDSNLILTTVIQHNSVKDERKQCQVKLEDQVFSIGQASLKTLANDTPAKIWPLKLERGNRCELLSINATSCKVVGCNLYQQYNGAAYLLKDANDAKMLAQELEKAYLKRALSEPELKQKIDQWQAAQAKK